MRKVQKLSALHHKTQNFDALLVRLAKRANITQLLLQRAPCLTAQNTCLLKRTNSLAMSQKKERVKSLEHYVYSASLTASHTALSTDTFHNLVQKAQTKMSKQEINMNK